MGNLPWSERVNMLSIHPHAATIEDIANLAADASENAALRARVAVLEGVVEAADNLRNADVIGERVLGELYAALDAAKEG